MKFPRARCDILTDGQRDRAAEHPLIALLRELVSAGFLWHSGAGPMELGEDAAHGSPAGREHNKLMRHIVDVAVVRTFRRSIEEGSDFKNKQTWRDVFRKLEDGPNLGGVVLCSPISDCLNLPPFSRRGTNTTTEKRTFKFHCQCAGRDRVKMHFYYLYNTLCKTSLHAAVCRCVAPLLPALRKTRRYYYSTDAGQGGSNAETDEHSVPDDRMCCISTPESEFEVWCELDITGAARARTQRARQRQREANRSKYSYRYTGPVYFGLGPAADPARNLALRGLMTERASMFKDRTQDEMRRFGEIIVAFVTRRVARATLQKLFDDAEWHWGSGRVKTFPEHLAAPCPSSTRDAFCVGTQAALPQPPPPAWAHERYVYSARTAARLTGSKDCFEEFLRDGCGIVIEETTCSRTQAFIYKNLMTREIVTARTRRFTERVLGLIRSAPVRDPRFLRIRRDYCAAVSRSARERRFFLRQVVLAQLPGYPESHLFFSLSSS